MAKVADLLVDQGSRWQAIISAPVEWLPDLSGYAARGKVRDSRTLPTSVVLFDLTGYMTVDGPNNLVMVDLPANITAAWTWTTGVYDMELFDGNPAHDVRFLQGKITVDKEATK